MYPTPLYAPAGHGAFTDVYEPADDSFLLMDALEKDAEQLKGSRPSVCLEVGCGSGVVSAFLASVLGPEALYLCTDVNPAAAQCTLQTARCNHLQLQPVITDLVQCLLPRLNGKVDVLVFNPPYVVTPSDETRPDTVIDRLWSHRDAQRLQNVHHRRGSARRGPDLQRLPLNGLLDAPQHGCVSLGLLSFGSGSGSHRLHLFWMRTCWKHTQKSCIHECCD
uniref:Methyltransferase HEMK2 n=1 Tax=Sinocyclocheilus rhinocerous TaxID=307959 RepID=A0A673LZZ0_9TELE